jgi:SAM-dependent methyltransferase
MRILDLACGPSKVEGAIGVDSNPRVEPDVLHDLDVIPYPFPDDSFDKIVCYNGIEHLARPLEVLQECARIGVNGGVVYLTTPHFTSPDAYTDPTHRHAFTSRSFDYLIQGTELVQFDYAKPCFEKVSIKVDFIALPRGVRGIIRRLANHDLLTYERRWAYLFPAHQMFVTLRIRK